MCVWVHWNIRFPTLHKLLYEQQLSFPFEKNTKKNWSIESTSSFLTRFRFFIALSHSAGLCVFFCFTVEPIVQICYCNDDESNENQSRMEHQKKEESEWEREKAAKK
jgi:hypothetical protein